MNVENYFMEIELQICNCKSGQKYFDSYRNMYVHMTPEEKVRQKTCKFISKVLGIPREAIKVEEHLMHYGVKDKNGRIDISISILDAEGIERPLAVIECKEKRIPIIAQQVLDQAENYASSIGAAYFIVINGIEMDFYHYNEKKNIFELVNGLLSYRDMIDDNYTVTENVYDFTRSPYEEYYDISKLKQYDWFDQKIGEDTDAELIPTILNLDDCMLDISHQLEQLPSKKYELISDIGTQYRKYGDASGGDFGSEVYRVLRLKDKEINKEFMIGFTITTTGKMIRDPEYGTSDGKSVLIIMKNDGERDEMSVQINMNKCLFVKEEKSIMTHNALITRKGKTKNGLLKYINFRNKQLVEGNNIILGTLDCSKSLYMNSDDVSIFLANAIEYAMYRDEYKNS